MDTFDVELEYKCEPDSLCKVAMMKIISRALPTVGHVPFEILYPQYLQEVDQ